MPRKYSDFEIQDAALSRRLWRKALSIDDENASNELRKESFEKYQRQIVQDDIQDNTFPACIQNEELRKCLFSLTKKQRRVIELYFFKNLTHQDIAEVLGCKRVCVTRLLHRAQERIRNLLSQKQ